MEETAVYLGGWGEEDRDTHAVGNLANSQSLPFFICYRTVSISALTFLTSKHGENLNQQYYARAHLILSSLGQFCWVRGHH
jgi:hypothetical protein